MTICIITFFACGLDCWVPRPHYRHMPNCTHDANDIDNEGRCRLCTNERKRRRRRARPAYDQQYQATYRRSVSGRAARLLASARQRSRYEGWPAPEIDMDWVEARMERGCEVSGLPFDPPAKGRGPRSASLDRRDCSKPYTKDNTRVVLWAMNAAFGEWGPDGFEPIARAWLRQRDLLGDSV